MAELITKKIHAPTCTADRPTVALQAFRDKFPNYCADCRATGKVTRSGLELPCGRCMNGNWKCPRCNWRPDNSNFWPGRCGYCNWSGAADGAPLADCDCPEQITIENIRPIGKKSAVEKDKRARLEAMAGITSAADAEPLDKNKPKTKRQRDNENERRQLSEEKRAGREFDDRIAEAE